jgi:hypothetical protein
MNGPEHYAAAQNLLSEASFRSGAHGYPVARDGRPLQPGEHEALLGQATVHALLAVAAVGAQLLADKYVGDGPHINAWRDTWVSTVVEAEIVCAGCSDPDGHPGPCTQPLTPDEQAAEMYAAGEHDDLPF